MPTAHRNLKLQFLLEAVFFFFLVSDQGGLLRFLATVSLSLFNSKSQMFHSLNLSFEKLKYQCILDSLGFLSPLLRFSYPLTNPKGPSPRFPRAGVPSLWDLMPGDLRG